MVICPKVLYIPIHWSHPQNPHIHVDYSAVNEHSYGNDLWAIFRSYLSLSEGIPPYLHKYCGWLTNPSTGAFCLSTVSTLSGARSSFSDNSEHSHRLSIFAQRLHDETEMWLGGLGFTCFYEENVDKLVISFDKGSMD